MIMPVIGLIGGFGLAGAPAELIDGAQIPKPAAHPAQRSPAARRAPSAKALNIPLMTPQPRS